MPVQDKNTGKWYYEPSEVCNINQLIYAVKDLIEHEGFQAFRDHLQSQVSSRNGLTEGGFEAAKLIIHQTAVMKLYLQAIGEWEHK